MSYTPPWMNATGYNNTSTFNPAVYNSAPIYTPPVISAPPGAPAYTQHPSVINPAAPSGYNPSGYVSPNPVADFICAPSHTTPWPHTAGYKN